MSGRRQKQRSQQARAAAGRAAHRAAAVSAPKTWLGSGINVPVPVGVVGRDPLAGEPEGAHVWTVVGAWRVDPMAVYRSGEQVFLDSENMLTLDGPGCFRCEEHWTPERAEQPCPGDPPRL